jgi:hypothetical protein
MLAMPEISKFYGIRIEMFFNDHNPPHFHAKYAEHKAEIDIQSLGILNGWLPGKAQALIIEWALAHRDELLMDWELARQHKPLQNIEPLQ